MESVFEAFISNPALYSEGHLVGETLHFPTNTEEVQSLLKRIGVDGVRCQEYFIIDQLSRELLVELIDHIKVYENGNISVRFKFADEFRRIAEYIEINTTKPAVAG